MNTTGSEMGLTSLFPSVRMLIVAAAVIGAVLPGSVSGALKPTDLRCEYAKAPTAIQTGEPRLSWILDAGQTRGVMQSAYQVLVASDSKKLGKEQGDLWDSGKVTTDRSIQVVYAGQPLSSGQACFWKVRVWDQDGKSSGWSKPAQWTMGLLNASDWKARWIGYQSPEQQPSDVKNLRLDDCKWVWGHEAKAGNQPAGKHFFRKIVEIPQDRTIKEARFLLAADDSFRLFINGHQAGQGSSWQNVASPEVGGRLQKGANAVGIEVTNGGETPSPAGLIGKLVVVFTTGEPMVVPINETWQSSREAGERWSWPDFDASGWQAATQVASYGDQPWGKIQVNVETFEPAPLFRKTFVVEKPIRRAMAYASALGLYELHLNGKTVDSDVLSPGWTDYRKRVHYFAYDITKELKQGDNAIGAVLGDGWYAGYLAFTGRRHYYGDHTRLLVQVQIDYQDGTQDIIASDNTWRATPGPVREGDLLMGCVYDARKELAGWDKPGFNDSTWPNAILDSAVKANLEAHPGAPMRRMAELPARKISEPQPGVYVIDLGQNMVGWVRLKAKGEAGQKVVLRHAEMLNPDGTIYTTNLRAAKATDTFFLGGPEKRSYEPYFTFHGFQYVEITGLNYKPDLGDVTGIVVYSDLPRAGWFECSEPLVNKLTHNSLWGEKGNFLDVPTDCPQRDERAGWTGDAQVFMKTACLNLEAPGFYTKWLLDLCQDSQREDGAFGDVAPHLRIVSHGNTGWSDAGPVCNWRLYEMYGDTRALEQHYPALVRHMGFLAATSKNYIRGTGAYGDWLRLAGPQHSDAIGTAYYYYAARLMGDIADAIGKREDVQKYRDLAENIRQTFVRTFIKEDGQIIDAKKETGQTFYALAFGLDLVPTEMKAKVAEQFVASIRKQDDHLATGFLGTPFVLFALQKAGHPELAYKLVLNKTYPSWLQQVIWGSTTMWERWDGWRPDKGFQDPGMNSFNHYWLGCVSEWLFTQAAGIDTDGPGFKRITVRPEVTPANGFDWVKASYNSAHGKVATQWKRTGDKLELIVSVPANTVATIYVPTGSPQTVREGSRPAAEAKAVRFIRNVSNCAVYQVGSGQYRFTSQLSQ